MKLLKDFVFLGRRILVASKRGIIRIVRRALLILYSLPFKGLIWKTFIIALSKGHIKHSFTYISVKIGINFILRPMTQDCKTLDFLQIPAMQLPADRS